MNHFPGAAITSYRPDIDGLRGIAVLAVVWYHLDLPFLPGGFAGVDIFFVISGYLITSIISAEIRARRFSFRGFYERRIRRIYPALFAVMGFSTLVGIGVLDPVTLKDLGQSLVAATLFSANVLFWHESDYFAPSALEKPLLHTWSLSVEEQFYFLFPPFLLLLFRCSPRWRNVLFGMMVSVSLLGSLFMTRSVPTAAFYLLPARGWELMMGAALALEMIPSPRAGWQRSLAAFGGAGLVLLSLVLLSKKTPFPGPGALFPVLGAAALIWSGTGSSSPHIVYRVLSSRPLVFIGLISYSLYLWHWPLIVFSDITIARPLSGPETVGLVLVMFAASFLSWKYIESPFRKRPVRAERGAPEGARRLNWHGPWIWAGALMTMAVMVGGWIHVRDGLRGRFPQVRDFATYANDPLWRDFAGDQAKLREISHTGLPRIIGAAGSEPSFMLWGDSHANSLALGLGEAARATGLSGYLASHEFGLKPLLGIAGFARRDDGFDEAAQNEAIIRFIERNTNIKLVILAGFWSYPGPYRDVGGELPDVTSPVELTRLGLFRTIERLSRAGRRVVVVHDVPTLDRSPRGRLWTAQVLGRDLHDVAESLGVSRHVYDRRNGPYAAVFKELSERLGASTVELEWEFFAAGPKLSRILHREGLLYVDNDHLSTQGSRFVAPALERVLADLKPVAARP